MTGRVNYRFPRVLYPVLVISLVALVGLAGCATDAATPSAERNFPDPALSPREVVAIQLEALGSDYPGDEGVEIAFRFASPSNRAMTGPVPRFAGMIRSERYRIMLDYERVEYAPVIMQGEVALQRVMLIRGDKTAVFDFYLRRQSIDPYVDCWMTEAVFRRGERTPGNGHPGEQAVPLETLTV